MTFSRILVSQAWLTMVSALSLCAVSYEPANFTPPKPEREFRGAWVATVGNIDWPSRPDLGVAEQKAELLAILDRATQLKLNAIIFQVRPACDALYASPIEPWSEYLTGAMGKAPQPFYDPLKFAVEEAHKRGLELHAWFNPYRAAHPSAKSPTASNHISKTKPSLVRRYGKHLWLDPGEKEVQDYSLSVVMDVVKRYDVDGIHFDDYFYPYKESEGGQEIDFPDDASWKRFGAGGKLSRDDWRRENVNIFIRRVYESIKATKPWVKFGVSPFGIWRPGNPPQIKGYDAYAELYADSRKWLVNGWLDYFTPQLYWAIEPKEQSFPVLLHWWDEQNSGKRHIWPGLNTTRARSRTGTEEVLDRTNVRTNASRERGSWKPDEIVSQIRMASKQPVSAGHVHWSMKSLMRSPELDAALERTVYAGPALIPACKWLDSVPCEKPKLSVATGNLSAKLSWETAPAEKTALWILQFERGGKWTTQILPGNRRSHILDGSPPEALALSAVDRIGNVSTAATLALRK
ncbi:MAG TPA: family 10 glycosylhydrolase [Verrucomicrobiae bacterium]|nr:family 10 glycosylhydrolase [Verrucomicrobiae bacterium]